MGKIFFYTADIKNKINNKRLIKNLLYAIFLKENLSSEQVVYVFCSDEYLLKINHQYLSHDTLTDVITFPFSKPDEPVKGEIYISIERIKENAKKYNVQYQNELLRVIIHGLLHLCGYNDKKKSEQLIMRSKEDYYLRQFKSFT